MLLYFFCCWIESSLLPLSPIPLCCSVAKSCLTLCDPMDCSMSGFPVHQYLPDFVQPCVHWIDIVIQQSHPLALSSPAAFSLSQHQGFFQWVGSSYHVAKVLELQLQHQSFQIIQDCFPLGLSALISLLSKGLTRVFSSTTVWKHQFFMVQLSHPYITTGKTIALTVCIFVGKVMSLLSNMLSRFVIAFLPRSKRLLISWLQSPSTVILEPKKIKSSTISIFSPIYLPWSNGIRCDDLNFLNVEFETPQ